MKISVKASVSLSGEGYENFGGILCINFPEMMIHERQITFLATKWSDGRGLSVSFFRDGELLFSITDFNNRECEIDMEERYGKTLDGRTQNGLSIVITLKKCVAYLIEKLEKEAIEDEKAFYKGTCFQFFITGVEDERSHEIICLMCRTRVRESTRK